MEGTPNERGRTPFEDMEGIAAEKYPAHMRVDDYELKYPPDHFCQEMGPYARVWRVYLEEAELKDRGVVEGLKEELEALLIFACLFSIVVVILSAQSCQKLDQDFSEISASLLIELIAVQRATATGSSVNNVPPSELSLTSPPRYSSTDAWVNGLLFISLILSLITALFAFLVKQWIQHYTSTVFSTPRERACLQHYRYRGLQQWKVSTIIAILPVLLFAAIFLFIVGLAVYLQALKPVIGYVFGGIGGVAFILYVAAIVLPLLLPQCPYYTPLVGPLLATRSYVSFAYRRLFFSLTHWLIPHLTSYILTLFPLRCYVIFSQLDIWCSDMSLKDPPIQKSRSPESLESEAAKRDEYKTVQNVLVWLLSATYNPSIRSIALQSISGLPLGFSHIDELLGSQSLVGKELERELEKHLLAARNFGDDPAVILRSPVFYNTERLLRASMLLPAFSFDATRPVWQPPSWEEFDNAARNVEPKLNSSYQYALTTFRLHSIKDEQEPYVALRSLTFPTSLSTTAKEFTAAWHAWANSIEYAQFVRELPYRGYTISTIFSSLGPLCEALVAPESDYETWGALLPFLSHFLPLLRIKQFYWELPKLLNHDFPIDPLAAVKVEFRVMLLRFVVIEWTKTPEQSAELENVVWCACDGLYELIDSLQYGKFSSVVPLVAAVLDELVNHQGFADSRWQNRTYEAIFKSYIRANIRYPLSARRQLTFHEHFHCMLTSKNALRDCIDDLMSTFAFNTRCQLTGITSQITRTLEDRGTDDIVTRNAFDAFMDIPWIKDFTVMRPSLVVMPQWPPQIQPLVRWILTFAISRAGTPGSDRLTSAFVTHLIEWPGFLTSICSPFLFGQNHEIVVNDESTILLDLATYHKDQSGASDVWGGFLSWVRDRSVEIHETRTCRTSWTRADFDRYERMAGLVDQIMEVLQLDDSGLRIPHFEERPVAETLQSKEQDPANTKRSNPRLSALKNLPPWRIRSHSPEAAEAAQHPRFP